MTFGRDGDTITLVMTVHDYEQLLIMTGYAIMAARMGGDMSLYRLFVTLVNAMNRTNPEFQQYKIP